MTKPLSDDTKIWMKLERLTAVIEENNRNQDRIFKTVYGDGNGQSGLVSQVQTIRENHNRNKWTVRTLIAATWTAFLSYITLKLK